jgi:hypothetical protein
MTQQRAEPKPSVNAPRPSANASKPSAKPSALAPKPFAKPSKKYVSVGVRSSASFAIASAANRRTQRPSVTRG